MVDDIDANQTRRNEILAHGINVLSQKGWRGMSMIAVARAASASKETLYNWFGDKTGFVAAMIRQNASALDDTLPAEFRTMPLDQGLTAFGTEFLRLITSEPSIALNRAAIAEAGTALGGEPKANADAKSGATPDTGGAAQNAAKPNHAGTLGQLILDEGKHKSLPIFARWLSLHLTLEDPLAAAEKFIVLIKGDWQLERLLGCAAVPNDTDIAEQVARAVADFQAIYVKTAP